jgi:hypothetical protein
LLKTPGTAVKLTDSGPSEEDDGPDGRRRPLSAAPALSVKTQGFAAIFDFRYLQMTNLS